MEEITIKASKRKQENKKWVKIFDCFDSGLFERSRNGIDEFEFSLKEMSIQPNMGFPPHSHANTDFIIIPTQGSIFQTNNLGESYKAEKGDIHLMSSGSGIKHFEYNPSHTEHLDCLVFEILPDVVNKTPQCLTISLNSPFNQLETIIPVNKKTGRQTLMNNVKAYYGKYQKGVDIHFNAEDPSNKLIVYVIKGCLTYNGRILNAKDTLGVTLKRNLKLNVKKQSQILLFEVVKKSQIT